MSKFHEEFLHQNSKNEDDLLEKCATPNGLKRILTDVGFFKRAVMTGEKQPISIWICNISKPWCKRKEKIAWGGEHPCSSYADICKYAYLRYADLPYGTPDRLTGIKHSGKLVEVYPKGINIEEVTPSYESEVPCKHGNFFVGYADMEINVVAQRTATLPINNGWEWEDFALKEYRERVIVELKPKITNVGAVIRQVKTYMEILGCRRGAVVTYSKLSRGKRELLKHESITPIQVGEGVHEL